MRILICLTSVLLLPVTFPAYAKKTPASPGKFVQGGIASWYGSDFHGKITSNGEVYDMYAMTAAHNTLPHGVYVKVKNSRNGRETVVRVNDRGPFISGRIIDLSYSAAKNLDMVDQGLAAVNIEALGYLDCDSQGNAYYRAPANYDCGPFGIQVGAYRMKENAENMVAQMKTLFGFASIHEADVKGDHYYRVRVGKFSSLREAKQKLKKITARLSTGGFVVALDSEK